MANVKIVTDSNSGITQEEAKKLGIFVLPMPFLINGEEFFEDVNLTQAEFYGHLAKDAAVSTSQPSTVSVTELWDNLLKDDCEIVHIPMSSGLSESCHTAENLAKEYNGRVHVVDNQRISITQKQSVYDAITLAKQGKSGAEIRDILLKTKFDSSIYISLETLKYLKKGGRLTPAAALIGTILKIKPVLQIQGAKLDAFKKVHTLKQAKDVMLTAIKNDLEKRFSEL
ncbi:MAG: DegV family protein, partial [Clostridia bacterium]|nr:DegV family protein [Clostridia bacterium]